MRTSGRGQTSEPEAAPVSAIEGLVDELLAYYIDWRQDAAAVKHAYRQWCATSGADEPLQFAAYMAALDREQSSADRYALVLEEFERALECGPPRRYDRADAEEAGL
ncbi:MAG: hypothetical protein JOZ58_02365 [Acetobacteraceae bacterium]|nr:hypothetical protein [Acetobacteraceae bacterium]